MTFSCELGAAFRIAVATMTVCSGLYGAAVLAVGQGLVPGRANGSLLRRADGTVVGSALIAQSFSRPEYLWPRLSAVDYQAAAAGGSNLSPAGPEVRARACATVLKYGASAASPLPVDLATASGSGLDPHVTLAAAQYQAGRIASARGVPAAAVAALFDACAERPPALLGGAPLVNVLRANLNLDNMKH